MKTSNTKRIFIIAVCMALQMTSFVIIVPLFARRFSELGSGVETLGISAVAYALTSTMAAPFMGALADRFGRRRLVLLSLIVYTLAFSGYLLARSAAAIIVIRGLAGAFTAGLVPAVIGITADLTPRERRGQLIGVVNGGASVGWIVGPILGGVLYDHWGYSVALMVSIGIAMATFLIAFFMVPETRPNPADYKVIKGKQYRLGNVKSAGRSIQNTLPSPVSTFVFLLWISFAVMFAWAFIEPRFMFYAYDDLHWTSSVLGLAMSTYGIAMALGEFGLSHLSDRLGRKPVILLGLILFLAQFIGLAFFRDSILIAVTFVIAGLGNALYDPALSASILDIAPTEHQVRALGIKSTAGSLGSILGPALVVLFSASVDVRGIFLMASGIVLLAISAGLPMAATGMQPTRNVVGSN
jgi:MFS family permease